MKRDQAKRETRPESPPSSMEIEKYQPGLYRYLLRRLHGFENQDAQDLVQDLYLRFLQVPHRDLIRQPQAYLYQIAAHLVSEYRLRRQRGLVTYDSVTADELSERAADVCTDDLGDRLNGEQEVARLENAIAELPKPYQAVLILRMRDGLSREDIARQLNLSPQTVKKYLFRAVAHCRAAARRNG